MNAAAIARALGGKPCSGGYVARCPVHDDRSPSLSIRDGDDRVLVTCFAGCNRRDILAELRQRGLLDGETSRRRDVLPGLRPVPPPPTDKIGGILRSTRPISGTLAETYLRNRGLDPELADATALRFLPAMGNYLPAMVAVVTDFIDVSRVLGLQFTPLRSDGTRGERTFLRGSRVAGGVIRLVEDAEVVDHLGLGEGTETCLAVMTAMKREGRIVLPVWPALNAGNMGNLPLVPGLERLTIYIDADAAGRKGGGNLAARWHAAGRGVFIATPAAGDWNESAAA